ncbi:MAG TPA: tetratricopeptide repeat protein [Gemmatimonadaceae bacterium]|nr:tetratricopeptide repeat protein [Gemmatimonadaceae bacterium]
MPRRGGVRTARRPARAPACLCGLLLGAMLAGPVRPVEAQQLPLKRAVPTDSATCPAASKPVVPSRAQREQARRLVAEGHAAAIVGDDSTARNRFKQAAALDGTDENIAYELARAYERTNNPQAAAREYCRYLALAPTSPDAADVRARIATLAPARSSVVPDRAAASFRAGLAAYDHQQWAAAEHAFGNAITAAPDWADPYYDRALTYAPQGSPTRAIADLERYLRLSPNAADRGDVTARIAALRQNRLNASTALASGIVPGLGQVYTHRPVLGLALLGAVAGTAYWAFQQHTVMETVPFTDPNGYSFTYQRPALKRTHLTVGLAAASALTIAGAVEAYLYAKHRGDGAAQAAAAHGAVPLPGSFAALPSVTARGFALTVGIALPFPIR